MKANPRKPGPLEIGQASFESEVLRAPEPVLVAFHAPWSRPCHILDSTLDEVASACTGAVKVVRVNADDNPDLSLWFEIESIPTLLFFVGGTLRARIVGTVSKEAILAKVLPRPAAGLEKLAQPRKPDK